MALEAGTKLGPYEIVSPLGAGGMGEVYRAKDTTLGRDVAIKVLPADVTSSPERLQRFEREAKTVAALNHPNIVTIHGIHNENDQRFIAMELVEGDTLDRMIAPGGMPLAKIFDIAIPLSDALAAAHGKGIVHRDLKPANVMVTKEGRVKVLDFGLAKLTAAGQGGSSPDDVTMSAPLTGRGMILGTVPYMSPEQLQGELVDHRTDLFSLGIMLYEMATGQRPFQGKNSASITSSILRDTPRPLHELNGVLPRHLGRIIEHCLEKDAEQRFQSAKDIRNELRALRKEVDSGGDFSESISTPATSVVPLIPTPSTTSSGSAMSAPTRRGEFWIGVGVLAVVLLAGAWFIRTAITSSQSPTTAEQALVSSTTDAHSIDSLAVLPFANASGDPDAEFLGDGIAESVINNLITIPGVRVVSRNTAFRHRGRESELDDVARDLNVRAILTGRVFKRGNRLVVSVALEDMDSHRQLWGERFDREFKDILILEREISERITDALKLTVNPAERGKSDTENPDARLAYMRGRFWWNKRTSFGFGKSLEQFDRAIQLDPEYALAYAGKATTYVILGMYTHAPLEVIPLGKRAAEKAIELDPTLAEAYTPLAWIQSAYERNWPAAEKLYLKAIELNPRYETAHHWYGFMLACIGRFDESEIEFKKALSIDPGSFVINRDHALPAMLRRDFAVAEQRMRHTAELYPKNVAARLWSSSITVSERRFDETIAYYREATTADGGTYSTGPFGYALGLAGRRSEALQQLSRLEAISNEQYVPATTFALIYAGLGDLDRAFEYFDRALEEQGGFLALLKYDATYDPLRHDPRFDRLLERIGFPSDLPAPVVAPWKQKQVRLAILPFENISNDPDTDYLSHEIPASIIDKLSGLSGLSVISRSGAFRFDSAKEDASSFGQSLGASVVLTGQLNARGNNLTIRVELVDVATNQQLWSKRYPRELTDIMAVETDITQSISEALRLRLTKEDETKLAKSYTKNAEAHRALLEGRFWRQKFTTAGWRRALGHFQDAVRIDPAYALAYAELSKAYSGLGIWFGDMPPDEAAPQGRKAAATAIALDDTLGEAHGALAFNRLFYDWDWSGAEEEFLRAIRLAPESGRVRLHYTILLRVMGRSREAEEVIKVTLMLDPTFPMNFVDLAFIYADMDRYKEGIAECRKALDLDPDFPPAYLALGEIYLAKGEYEEAITHFERNSSLRNRQTIDLGYLGSAYALAGQRDKALAILKELQGVSSRGRGQYAAAMIHAGLGNADAAFASLEDAYEKRDPGLMWLNTEFQFKPLRGDPRFDDLLRRLGLTSDSESASTVRDQNKKTMLAVLPFANLSGDPEQEYFSDGMTEEMITRLGRLRPELLGVIARTSAMRYKRTDKPIDQIGRELGVSYVIEGGVRRSGNSVRINAQLIQVSDQTQLWGDSYTRDLSDVFAVQAEVAEAVAKSLALELLPQARTTQADSPTESSAAYDAYLFGRSHWAKRTPESLHFAIKHFQRAIELDPNYTLAYAGLADTWGVLPYYVSGPYNEMNAEAKKAAEKALALDDSLAESHVAMSIVLADGGDLEAGVQHLRSAVAIDPNNATAHQWLGDTLAMQGHYDEAVEEIEKAIALDPLSAVIRDAYSKTMLLARRFDKAIAQSKRALELQADFFNAATRLMWAHIGKGDHVAAAGSFETYLRITHQTDATVSAFRRTNNASGLRAGLVEWLDSQESDPLGLGPGARAGIYAWCNEKDRAFELLDLAIERGDPSIQYLKAHIALDDLRDDPRYEAFLRKAGLSKIDTPPPSTTP